jgi:hypothetical protein
VNLQLMFDLKSFLQSRLVFQHDMSWCLKIMVLLAECVDHIQFGLNQLQAKCFYHVDLLVVQIDLVLLDRWLW